MHCNLFCISAATYRNSVSQKRGDGVVLSTLTKWRYDLPSETVQFRALVSSNMQLHFCYTLFVKILLQWMVQITLYCIVFLYCTSWQNATILHTS